METKEVIATPDNYLEILDSKAPKEVLELVCGIAYELKLRDLGYYSDNPSELYWCEKPWKFPEFWIPALNGDSENIGNLELVAE